MRILGIFLTLFLVAGCMFNRPSSAKYEDELSKWIGQSEENLYSEWGYPNTTYSISGNSFVATYIKQYKEAIDDDKTPYADSMTYSAMRVPNYGLPVTQGIYYCKTSFVITNGIVTDYNFNGDDCVR